MQLRRHCKTCPSRHASSSSAFLPASRSSVVTSARCSTARRAACTRPRSAPAWYFHLPWNHFVIYDLRWKEHHESDPTSTPRTACTPTPNSAVVVRPNPDEIYDLDVTVGPASTRSDPSARSSRLARDGGGQFHHLDVAMPRTHEALSSRSRPRSRSTSRSAHRGRRVFRGRSTSIHLPPEVEAAANRTAAPATSSLRRRRSTSVLAQKDADIVKEQRRGTIEAEGLERKLRAEHEPRAAERPAQDRGGARASPIREKQEADAEAARAARPRPRPRRSPSSAPRPTSQRIARRVRAPDAGFVRLEAIKALADALASAKLVVVPVGPNGLPSLFFQPFLNPLNPALDAPK